MIREINAVCRAYIFFKLTYSCFNGIESSLFMHPPFYLVSVVQTTQYVYSIERSIDRKKIVRTLYVFNDLFWQTVGHLSKIFIVYPVNLKGQDKGPFKSLFMKKWVADVQIVVTSLLHHQIQQYNVFSHAIS